MGMEPEIIYTNIIDWFRAHVTGIEVDDDGRITIRGISTFSSSNGPLILFDGIEISTITDLNPNEIQSVEVLKGPDKIIYGFRGSEGVILITSKTAYEAKKKSGK